MKLIKILLTCLIVTASCNNSGTQNKGNNKNSPVDITQQYGYNRDFLKKYTEIIELKNDNSALTLAPSWQGRVMTSTSEGETGYSYGWINHDLIASGNILPHINAYGGEERLWLGPEGGQFSIFFAGGKSFTFENWQTPAFLDTSPFDIVSTTETSARFASNITTKNYSGTTFNFRIEREVVLMSDDEILTQTQIDVSKLRSVAYRSVNTIINQGDKAWTKETGLLSVWMLGMLNPSPSVVVVIPVKNGDETIIGPKVNDNYFGKISDDRLKVSDDIIFFKADGKSRGKIGISPQRAKGIMGSYDPDHNLLTLLICRLPDGETDYVNSSWQLQDNPYSGDALNSYNDGPLEDGSQMGPFYELETSSPAAKLEPGESLSHIQVTLHITGDYNLLDEVSRKILGISLEEISRAF